MSVHTRRARRRRTLSARARLFAAGLVLAGVLATGLALDGVLPAPLARSAARVVQPAKVEFGLPSRVGLRRVGAAPGSFPVTLQLGLVANQRKIASAARAASDPASPAYGVYPTLPEFARRLGAPAARRHAVLDALHAAGIRGAVDATGLRVTAGLTIGRMERLFATKWSLYATGSAHVFVALPDGQPQIPKGLRG